MKFLATVLSLAAAAVAQSITIGAPTEGSTLTVGSNTTVSVVRFNTLTGSTEVGIGITLHHCSQNPCEDAEEVLGDILYAGPYNPQIGVGIFGEPAENLSVAIPAGFASGPAVLSVAHASLVGAGPFFLSEIRNVTVNVV